MKMMLGWKPNGGRGAMGAIVGATVGGGVGLDGANPAIVPSEVFVCIDDDDDSTSLHCSSSPLPWPFGWYANAEQSASAPQAAQQAVTESTRSRTFELLPGDELLTPVLLRSSNVAHASL
jgi:hypothetical protein